MKLTSIKRNLLQSLETKYLSTEKKSQLRRVSEWISIIFYSQWNLIAKYEREVVFVPFKLVTALTNLEVK
ncbi:CLUMA_CG008516, isoform A [Clunio marinus]|uniref:CLUMA_CG008516, isoform A n=1 Tax=Clunio marinus TaxID=568069 RepID=A0A1J1I7U4_9DIPT|nr:CLUMA_CG008516, isoform A [Clunio marinus]